MKFFRDLILNRMKISVRVMFIPSTKAENWYIWMEWFIQRFTIYFFCYTFSLAHQWNFTMYNKMLCNKEVCVLKAVQHNIVDCQEFLVAKEMPCTVQYANSCSTVYQTYHKNNFPPSRQPRSYQNNVCTRLLFQSFLLQVPSRNDTDPQSNHLLPCHQLHPVVVHCQVSVIGHINC